MNFRSILKLFSFRDLRNILLSLAIVFGGIGLTLLTLYANRIGEPRLTAISAALSLVFVLLTLIFVIPPLARNAGKEASQINLPFDFTIGGAIMLGLLLIVGFSAWNTGNNLLFLVLSFLAAAMLVGFIAGSLMLKKVDVKMRFPESIIAGEETPIYVGLQNRKRLFPAISVVAEVRGTQRERSIAAEELEDILPGFLAKRLSKPPVIRRILDHFEFVGRNTSAENRPLHIFPTRGRFLIKDFEISTKFPFLFFRHRRRLTAKETELIVFPRSADLEDLLHSVSPLNGNLSTTAKGYGQELFALRDYQSNDDLRSIDWKATARSRRLTVKEFEAEDDLKTTIVLDRRMPAELLDNRTLREKIDAERKGTDDLILNDRFEKAVSIAAALLDHYSVSGAEIRLVIDGAESEFGTGIAHIRDCMRELALAEAKKADSPLLTNTDDLFEKQSRIVVISCIETEESLGEKIKNAELINY